MAKREVLIRFLNAITFTFFSIIKFDRRHLLCLSIREQTEQCVSQALGCKMLMSFLSGSAFGVLLICLHLVRSITWPLDNDEHVEMKCRRSPLHQAKAKSWQRVSSSTVTTPCWSPLPSGSSTLPRCTIGYPVVAVLMTPMIWRPIWKRRTALCVEAKYKSVTTVWDVLAHGSTSSCNMLHPWLYPLCSTLHKE